MTQFPVSTSNEQSIYAALELSKNSWLLAIQVIESVNGRFRDECLNENWFLDLDDAREIIEAWRIDYNTSRPHSALDYATPEEFASSLQGHAPGEMTTSARPGQNQQPGLSC